MGFNKEIGAVSNLMFAKMLELWGSADEIESASCKSLDSEM